MTETISIKESLPKLCQLHDTFAGNASFRLNDLFKQRVDIIPLTSELDCMGEFIKSLPVPIAINTIHCPALNCNFFLVIDARAVFSLVERAMGGGPHRPHIPGGRYFTYIEHIIIRKITETLIKALKSAWSSFIVDIDFKFNQIVVSPDAISGIDIAENVIISIFEMETDTSLGSILLVIPLKALDPIKPLLASNKYNLRVIATGTTFSDISKEYLQSQISKDKIKKDIVNNAICSPDKSYFGLLNGRNKCWVAEVLRNEHPQTLACIFSMLKPEVAAEQLLYIPKGIQSEVISRIGNINIRTTAFLDDIEDFLYEKTMDNSISAKTPAGEILEAVKLIDPLSFEMIAEELEEEGILKYILPSASHEEK